MIFIIFYLTITLLIAITKIAKGLAHQDVKLKLARVNYLGNVVESFLWPLILISAIIVISFKK